MCKNCHFKLKMYIESVKNCYFELSTALGMFIIGLCIAIALSPSRETLKTLGESGDEARLVRIPVIINGYFVHLYSTSINGMSSCELNSSDERSKRDHWSGWIKRDDSQW